ncbi:hypothetical protein R5R35_005966 [Gryllus longicercus]|uniref:Autophagy-related protein 101 n=1 Tax=Gryllus longicercus TaxID=2509291 RepID=A0AAN9Z1S7_9ORTH
MNARSHTFELTVEGQQVQEVVSSLFHTVLLYRTFGKLHFNNADETSYSVGTVGYNDVDCDFVNFTYVSCSSEKLSGVIKNEVSAFLIALRENDGEETGQISLEFFQKKRNRWPFNTENIPWEVWTIRLHLITVNNEDQRRKLRQETEKMLKEKVFDIAEIMNRHDFVPEISNPSELGAIFDTTYPDVQPYLFKIYFSTISTSQMSLGKTVKKFIKDSLLL